MPIDQPPLLPVLVVSAGFWCSGLLKSPVDSVVGADAVLLRGIDWGDGAGVCA
jgi:hypothetical protein